MSNWKKQLRDFLETKHSVALTDDQIDHVRKIILEGHEGKIFESEMDKVRKTKKKCASIAESVILNGKYPNQETLAEAVKEAIINRAETPNLTNSVRYMVAV